MNVPPRKSRRPFANGVEHEAVDLDTNLRELDFPLLLCDKLAWKNIRTLRDLKKAPTLQLMEVENFGWKMLEVLDRQLEERFGIVRGPFTDLSALKLPTDLTERIKRFENVEYLAFAIEDDTSSLGLDASTYDQLKQAVEAFMAKRHAYGTGKK